MTVPRYTISLLEPPDWGAIARVHDLPWSRIAARLRRVDRTAESTADYLLWKESGDPRAGAVKSADGGWVGGVFKGGRRAADGLVHRTVLALDIDEPSDRCEDELRSLGCALAVHPTHTPGRWRAAAPLSEPLDGPRYRRLVERLAGRVTGVDMASANPCQLMFWPSTPADDARGTWTVDGPPLDWTAYDLGEPEPERTDISDIPEDAVEAIERLMRADRGRMVEAMAAELSTTPEGARNDTLNRFAHALARAGCSDGEVRAALEWAGSVCGLPAGEVRATLDSAIGAGERHHDAAVARVYDETVDVRRRALGLFGVDPDAPAAPAAPGASSADGMMVPAGMMVTGQSMADTPPEEMPPELWEGRIPMCGVTLVSGMGGIGKSIFDCWLAARVSRGELPGALSGRPSPVLLLQTEDEWASETRFRLQAAGADPALVLRGVLTPVGAVAADDGSAAGDPFIPKLPEQAEQLEALVDAYGAKLAVVDVLTAVMGEGRSTNEQVDVRRLMTALQNIARRRRVAIVCVNHWRKSSEGAAGDRVAGSHEFRNAARCLWLAARDDTTGRTVMRLDKYNRGRPGAEFSYRIGDDPVAGAPRVEDLRDEPRGAFEVCTLPEHERIAVEVLRARLEEDGRLTLTDAHDLLYGSKRSSTNGRDPVRGGVPLRMQPSTIVRLLSSAGAVREEGAATWVWPGRVDPRPSDPASMFAAEKEAAGDRPDDGGVRP